MLAKTMYRYSRNELPQAFQEVFNNNLVEHKYNLRNKTDPKPGNYIGKRVEKVIFCLSWQKGM